MELTSEEYELIERSLAGTLTDSDKQLFDKKYEDSPMFREETDFQKGLIDQIEAQKTQDLRQEMRSHLEMLESKKNRRSSIWYYAAASIIILITTISVFNFFDPSADELYSSYYQPYDGAVIQRGDESPYNKGLIYYQKGEFSLALEEFLSLDQESINFEVQLLIGNCYLSLDKSEQAIEWFSKISENELESVKSIRDWYLAISYLSMKEVSKSKNLLLAIKSSNSIYKDQATLLLKESVFN